MGELEEIELVLVFAEPGDPYPGEMYTEATFPIKSEPVTLGLSRDLFHKNVRYILEKCWPGADDRTFLKKVSMTESVLCSATREGGQISKECAMECANRYLIPQLNLLSHALVVALGTKARNRLHGAGYPRFLAAAAVAPPGCNFSGARESWDRIPAELRRIR